MDRGPFDVGHSGDFWGRGNAHSFMTLGLSGIRPASHACHICSCVPLSIRIITIATSAELRLECDRSAYTDEEG
jgi:hypothetical protein